MSYTKNVAYVDTLICEGFDITKREIHIQNNTCYLCYINSLNSSVSITELIKGIYFSKQSKQVSIFNGSITPLQKVEESIVLLLSGQCLLLVQDGIYIIETRNYPNKPTSEAQNEQSIRGSHDSFTENIILNAGLIRRRIRSVDLAMPLYKVGRDTKCDISLVYMKDRVNPVLLQSIQEKIKSLNDLDILYDRTLIDHLFPKSLNPYPKVRLSERPDIVGVHLLQGYIVLLIDNSFNAVILPTTFFELTKQLEEYTQSNIIALFIRFIRLSAVFCSVYLSSIWVLYNQGIHFEIDLLNPEVWILIFQIGIIELFIEWIRLCYIHTPGSIAGILAFLVIFLLGESAVKFDLYSEIILVVVVLCNLGNFVTPNYELSLANKLSRLLLCLCTALFNIIGFVVVVVLHFILLLKTKSYGMHYLYPIIPFNKNDLKQILLGTLTQKK